MISTAPFVLVTGSHGKIAEARVALGHDVEAVEMDLPEIQGLNVLEIVREKAEAAWQRVQRPLVVEEACLSLLALNGFPGPLIKWMLMAVGAEGISKTAHALNNDRAVARCVLLYKDGERTVMGEGMTTGKLIHPGRGEHGFGWDPVFLADGENRTFAELTGKEKDAVSHRGKAWRDLLSRIRG